MSARQAHISASRSSAACTIASTSRPARRGRTRLRGTGWREAAVSLARRSREQSLRRGPVVGTAVAAVARALASGGTAGCEVGGHLGDQRDGQGRTRDHCVRAAGGPDRHDAVPGDGGCPGVEVEAHSRVLVDPEHEGPRRQLALHGRQALLPQVAVPRVVGAAFGVVVVRDDDDRQAHGGQQVETLDPARIFADLVDLVHGDTQCTEGESCSRGEGEGAAEGELLGQDRRDQGVAPLAQRICGAPRTGEHERGGDQLGHDGVTAGAMEVGGGAQARDLELGADAVAKVVDRPHRDLRCVRLEAERRVQQEPTWSLTG